VSDAPTRVLFVSTGGACRSIFAEALLRHVGGPRYEVLSCGTDPAAVDPLTYQILATAGIDASGCEPRSLTDLQEQSFDYVITLCDDARLVCPVFPGADQSMHWGYPSPSKVVDEAQRRAAFERVFTLLGERIRQFVLIAERTQPAAAAG
jgi:protein-tyrosine-phosphatase